MEKLSSENPVIRARSIVIENERILLVRNKDADFWYPPGGGWEASRETITDCAEREVSEETGYLVSVNRLLWAQEFHEKHQIFFETFWLAQISESNTQTDAMLKLHIDEDPDGEVAEGRWFSEQELEEIVVYPERIKKFSVHIKSAENTPDPFIGSFL